MPLPTLSLLLAAAVCHACWNLLLKRAEDRYIVTWWAILIASILFLPLVFAFKPAPWLAWKLALCSGVFEAAYYITLAKAYRHGDFSLVYPMARGTAPALLLLWSVLFLHESLRPGGLAGVAIVLVGLLTLGSSELWRNARHATPSAAAVALALTVALFISLYSVIDGAAVRHVNPIAYTGLIFALTTAFVTPAIAVRYDWGAVVAVGRRQWRIAAAIGVVSPLAYMLVLIAYAQGHVSYAGAIREISIVFGALAGWRWLHEEFGAVRTAGALLVFVGILLIATAG